ncbi:MAG: polysaccharide deacetylase family protein, partial [Candidatus Omnitrophica bacterium]|nr:polysaccharide deacetylase family protein [Candidatus Omnitrophota bacterium]
IVPGPRRKIPGNWFLVTFDDGYADNCWFALPVLYELKIPALIFLTVSYINTPHLFSRYQHPERDRFLTWEEARKMRKYRVEFGSHSLTHQRLTDLPLDQARKEVTFSRSLLQEKLEQSVSFFCYPYGAWNETVISLVGSAGFQAGMVTNLRSSRFSPFTLPRVGIYGHNNLAVFRLKLTIGQWKEKKYFGFSS